MKTLEERKTEAISHFKEIVTDMITSMFKVHGSFDPTVFVLVVEGNKLQIGIVPDIGKLFVNDTGKDLACFVIKKLNDTVKPIALAFAAEGWCVVKEHKGPAKDYKYDEARPSEHPNKEEILFVNFETFDKECNLGWAIVRNIIPEGELIRRDVMCTEWAPKGDRFAGRFSNLLTDNYSELNKLANQAKENTN